MTHSIADSAGATKQRKQRCQSASEIARNIKSFETWSSYQGCEEVAFADIPEALEVDAKSVFNVMHQLPKELLDETSYTYQALGHTMSREFLDFLRIAYTAKPKLFSRKVSIEDNKDLIPGLQCVFAAWQRLEKMRKSSRNWSEADYVANVYIFRSAAVSESDFRAQCPVSLAQPLTCFALTEKAVRTLNAKSALPDTGIYVPARLIRHLSDSATSPYKVLNAWKRVSSAASVGGESTLRYQSTPCLKLPETACFEFASAFWEDKKPLHHLLDDAYRQNRMATTSAVRQLHSLKVNVPIFGLVWAQGTVRAHVDWWTEGPNRGYPCIRSAPYPGPSARSRRTSGNFHEWHLERPCDIIQVFLLVRNMDRWTVGPFRKRISVGIDKLVSDVVDHGHEILPWRRKGDITRLTATGHRASSASQDLPRRPRRGGTRQS